MGLVMGRAHSPVFDRPTLPFIERLALPHLT
jgi:hypothetical protein